MEPMEPMTNEQVYFDDWEGGDKSNLAADFYVELGDDINILFASYTYEDYSGHAYVLFEQGGKLYEVAGSHCSCYGLEDQWEPDETTPEAALSFLTGSQYYVENPEAKAVLIARLEAMKAKGEAA